MKRASQLDTFKLVLYYNISLNSVFYFKHIVTTIYLNVQEL